MNQEITLSKNIFSFLDKNLPSFKKVLAHDVIEIIDQNYICSDKQKKILIGLMKEFENISSDKKKEELKDLVDNWLSKRVKFIDVKSNNSNELQVSKESKDKILFDPYPNDRLCELSSVVNVEVYDAKLFAKPNIDNRLKNCPSKFLLKPNNKYNLRTLFEPFLREAKRVEFQDPFIANKKAFHNLKLILNFIQTKNIGILTYNFGQYVNNSRESKYEEKNYKNFIDFAKSKKIKLEYFIKRKHQERYIITEDVRIKLPGGLDIFNFDGTVKIDNPEKELMEITIDKNIKFVL